MDLDKLSLLDFDIEEKDEVSSPERKLSPDNQIQTTAVDKQAGHRDVTYFSALLAKRTDEADVTSPKTPGSPENKLPSSGREPKAKKFPKLSQKERKRLSLESAVEAESTKPAVVSSPTKAWGGWNAPVSPSSAPSLFDIMHMEGQQQVGTSSKERKLSETDARPQELVKKSSWKQMDWRTELEEAPPVVRKPAANPWTARSPTQQESVFADLLAAEEELNRSFSEIMEEDVREEQTWIQAKTKPLHLTQTEEKAMQEFKKAYELQHPGDVITVARVDSGNMAAPVWKKKKT